MVEKKYNRYDEILGERIKAVRLEHNVKLKDAAKIAGVSYAQYGHYERGETRIPFCVLCKILKSLNVTLVGFSAGINIYSDEEDESGTDLPSLRETLFGKV